MKWAMGRAQAHDHKTVLIIIYIYNSINSDYSHNAQYYTGIYYTFINYHIHHRYTILVYVVYKIYDSNNIIRVANCVSGVD